MTEIYLISVPDSSVPTTKELCARSNLPKPFDALPTKFVSTVGLLPTSSTCTARKSAPNIRSFTRRRPRRPPVLHLHSQSTSNANQRFPCSFVLCRPTPHACPPPACRTRALVPRIKHHLSTIRSSTSTPLAFTSITPVGLSRKRSISHPPRHPTLWLNQHPALRLAISQFARILRRFSHPRMPRPRSKVPTWARTRVRVRQVRMNYGRSFGRAGRGVRSCVGCKLKLGRGVCAAVGGRFATVPTDPLRRPSKDAPEPDKMKALGWFWSLWIMRRVEVYGAVRRRPIRSCSWVSTCITGMQEVQSHGDDQMSARQIQVSAVCHWKAMLVAATASRAAPEANTCLCGYCGNFAGHHVRRWRGLPLGAGTWRCSMVRERESAA
ncbi:hypothetical protein BJ912DRAFT_639772 [Pholiota molesta]|nr:hypothetical protein BJ912DRAFT_639772 [Pholiota molesta]